MANDIQATIDGSTSMQHAQDAASISRFLFPRSYVRSDLILQADPDALQWAYYVLAIAKGDESRFDALTIQADDPGYDLFPQVLGRDLGDRIQVWRHPPGTAAICKDCFIRSITHTITIDGWVTEWGLQNAGRYSFFVLDAATLGQLDAEFLSFLPEGPPMPLPTWTAGQVLAASDVNTWFVPLSIVNREHSRASNTSITADPHLLLALDANAIYQVEALIV